MKPSRASSTIYIAGLSYAEPYSSADRVATPLGTSDLDTEEHKLLDAAYNDFNGESDGGVSNAFISSAGTGLLSSFCWWRRGDFIVACL